MNNNQTPAEIRALYLKATKDETRYPCSTGNPGYFASHREALTPCARNLVELARTRLGRIATTAIQAKPGEVELFDLVSSLQREAGDQLSEQEKHAVVAALSATLDHYDILSALIENPQVNDIIVRSWNDISIQVDRRNIQTDLQFSSSDSYKAFVENLLKRAGKSLSMSTPVIDGAIDEHIRVCATHESFSPPGSGPMLTLRISRHRQTSLEDLSRAKLAPPVILDYLATLLAEGNTTIVVAGEVATGKTTLVKALAMRIPAAEAILTIEDTHELTLKRRFVRTLLTRESNAEGSARISPAQAIRTGMRLAMNRIILGELRDSEAAEAFIDVAASGHPGVTTIHARSARDALQRFEILLSRAEPGVGFETIRKQIANAVGLVVFLALEKETGLRRIYEVIEVGHSMEGNIQILPIFSFQPRNEEALWLRGSAVSQYRELLDKEKVFMPIAGQTLRFDPEDDYPGSQ